MCYLYHGSIHNRCVNCFLKQSSIKINVIHNDNDKALLKRECKCLATK